jgi:hypothetical protein
MMPRGIIKVNGSKKCILALNAIYHKCQYTCQRSHWRINAQCSGSTGTVLRGWSIPSTYGVHDILMVCTSDVAYILYGIYTV